MEWASRELNSYHDLAKVSESGRHRGAGGGVQMDTSNVLTIFSILFNTKFFMWQDGEFFHAEVLKLWEASKLPFPKPILSEQLVQDLLRVSHCIFCNCF